MNAEKKEDNCKEQHTHIDLSINCETKYWATILLLLVNNEFCNPVGKLTILIISDGYNT